MEEMPVCPDKLNSAVAAGDLVPLWPHCAGRPQEPCPSKPYTHSHLQLCSTPAFNIILKLSSTNNAQTTQPAGSLKSKSIRCQFLQSNNLLWCRSQLVTAQPELGYICAWLHPGFAADGVSKEANPGSPSKHLQTSSPPASALVITLLKPTGPGVQVPWSRPVCSLLIWLW